MTRTLGKELGKELEAYRRKHGLNQDELAARLRVSQSHLSRIISGAVAPGNKLVFRINQLLKPTVIVQSEAWIEQVRDAAKRSSSFRRLVSLALEIVDRR